MKSILLSGTTALLLMAASGAYAQADQHANDQQHPAGPAHAGPQGSGPADHNAMSGDHSPMRGDHGTMSGSHTMSGPASNNPTPMHRTDNDRRTTTRTTTTNTWNHGSSDYNHSSLTNNNRFHGRPHPKISVNLKVTLNARHHFRGPTWHPPHGYAYHRYNVGQRLAPAFYARDYWLTDYAAYDLIAPPDGYTWVRFGPDAILIDEDTGDVVRVVYGIFM